MTALQFIIGCLATFRLSSLFAKEQGPGKIFKKLRESAPPKSNLREGLSCPLCESLWFGPAIALGYVLTGVCGWIEGALAALAFSGASVCLSLTIGKKL